MIHKSLAMMLELIKSTLNDNTSEALSLLAQAKNITVLTDCPCRVDTVSDMIHKSLSPAYLEDSSPPAYCMELHW